MQNSLYQLHLCNYMSLSCQWALQKCEKGHYLLVYLIVCLRCFLRSDWKQRCVMSQGVLVTHIGVHTLSYVFFLSTQDHLIR